MSLSPAEQRCPDCTGVGNTVGNPWKLCKRCGGLGSTWLAGGPAFGCRMTLGDRMVGEIVELGTGHRGRIMRHHRWGKIGPKTTFVALINPFDDTQDTEPTGFPSEVGVASVAAASWARQDSAGEAKAREDHLDPLQKKKAL